jgi:hypothetical protein
VHAPGAAYARPDDQHFCRRWGHRSRVRADPPPLRRKPWSGCLFRAGAFLFLWLMDAVCQTFVKRTQSDWPGLSGMDGIHHVAMPSVAFHLRPTELAKRARAVARRLAASRTSETKNQTGPLTGPAWKRTGPPGRLAAEDVANPKTSDPGLTSAVDAVDCCKTCRACIQWPGSSTQMVPHGGIFSDDRR